MNIANPEVTKEAVFCPGQFVLLLLIIASDLTVSENRMTGEDILPACCPWAEHLV